MLYNSLHFNTVGMYVGGNRIDAAPNGFPGAFLSRQILQIGLFGTFHVPCLVMLVVKANIETKVTFCFILISQA